MRDSSTGSEPQAGSDVAGVVAELADAAGPAEVDGIEVDAIWERVRASGAPIVQTGPETSEVTFLYRGRGSRVAVQGGVFGGFTEGLLDRIGQTDVFAKSFTIPNAVRMSYAFLIDPPEVTTDDVMDDPARMAEMMQYFNNPSNFAPDPLNPLTLGRPAPEGAPMPMRAVLELPDAPPQPFVAKRPGIPRGWLEQHTYTSQILGNERFVWTYKPSGDGPFPLLVVFDGGAYLTTIPTHRILDNLAADGLVPPMAAVFVNPALGQRNVELPCNDQFADFLVRELLPWVREQLPVSSDPREVAVAGSSYGGLASSFMALRHPEIFGNVLSQSGSYMWGPGFGPGDDRPRDDSQREWLIRRFEEAPPSATRFYLDAGTFEVSERANMPGVNRTLRDVLLGKGHEVHYQEFVGGHDYACWAGTFADGLLALFGSR